MIAEQTSRFANVSKSLRHVAGLHRQAIDKRAAIEILFQQLDQLVQFDGARFAQIKDLIIARRVINRRAHARNDVVNVSVIAAGRAVSEDRNLLSFIDEAREFVNRQIGPLPRAVNREEA